MKKLLVLLALSTTALASYSQVKKTKSGAPAQPTVKPADKASPNRSATATNTSKTQATVTPVKKPAPVPQKKDEGFTVNRQNFLNLGVGLGTFYRGLPFGASFEHGFSDNISAGVFADYSSYNYGSYFGSGDKLTIIYAGVRGSYHFSKLLKLNIDQLDLYGGASLGYHHVSYSFDNSGYYGNPYNNSVFFGVHLGGRYMLTDHIGAFAEVGYGVAALKVGATLKF